MKHAAPPSVPLLLVAAAECEPVVLVHGDFDQLLRHGDRALIEGTDGTNTVTRMAWVAEIAPASIVKIE